LLREKKEEILVEMFVVEIFVCIGIVKVSSKRMA
jgi:hypothetical protein